MLFAEREGQFGAILCGHLGGEGSEDRANDGLKCVRCACVRACVRVHECVRACVCVSACVREYVRGKGSVRARLR